MGKNVSAIIPVYNEEDRIVSTIESIRKVKSINEIIVVDDGSTDSTFNLLKNEKDIAIVKNERNRGKGSAIRLGLTKVNNDFIALVDGDLGESASKFEKLTDKIGSIDNAIIVGIMPPAKNKGGFGFVKSLSCRGIQQLTSVRVNSVLSGQRVLPTNFLKGLELPDGFAVEFKITLEAIRNGYKIVEIPVEMYHRETKRDLKGFIHRGKQYCDIYVEIKKELMKKQEIH